MKSGEIDHGKGYEACGVVGQGGSGERVAHFMLGNLQPTFGEGEWLENLPSLIL